MMQKSQLPENLKCLAGLVVFVSLGALILLVLSSGAKVWAMPGQAPLRDTVPVLITLTVTLQRPNAPPPDPSWAVPAHCTLYPSGDPDAICDEWDLTLDESGSWSDYRGLGPGQYDVRIKNPHTLCNVRHAVNITGPISIDMGELLEGDANDDNWVKGDDFSILRTSYWRQEGQPGFDDRADFDEDGWVKGPDFSLLRSNYWEHGDIPLTLAHVDLGGQSTCDGVTISVAPVSSTVHLDDVFTVTIQVDAGAQQVDTVDADMTFPAGFLVVVDASGEATDRVIPGPALDVELYNSVDNGAGTLTYSAGTGFFDPPPSGTFTLATIRFQAQGTVADGSLHFTEATDAYFEGRHVLDTRLDGVVTVSGCQVFLPMIFKNAPVAGT